MDKKDLSIEFRAVPYGYTSHELQYRVSPDQDLTYYKEYSLLWGLIRFTMKKKYDILWKGTNHFICYITSKYYDIDDDFNYCPILCTDKKSFDWYKENFKTLGEFEKYLDELENKNISQYKKEREELLKLKNTVFY